MSSKTPDPASCADFKTCFDQVAAYAATLGLHVTKEFIGTGTTGNFDGEKIIIDTDQTDEQGFYVLLHLIGHSYQWDTDAELRKLGLDVLPGKDEVELDRIYHYERAASEIGMYVLHQVGIHDLDQWISDWFCADWKWLHHYYTTGEALPYDSTFVCGAGEMLTERPMGPFTPHAYVMRQAFD